MAKKNTILQVFNIGIKQYDAVYSVERTRGGDWCVEIRASGLYKTNALLTEQELIMLLESIKAKKGKEVIEAQP